MRGLGAAAYYPRARHTEEYSAISFARTKRPSREMKSHRKDVNRKDSADAAFANIFPRGRKND